MELQNSFFLDKKDDFYNEFNLLNQEKKDVFTLMENTNNNLIISGEGGVGKSYILKFFKKYTSKNVLYVAPTGISAMNIAGVTMHSIFGFNNLKDGVDVMISFEKKQIFKNIDMIIIDEDSMVRVDQLTQIDKILKLCNSNNLPFGGKQIVMFGDLFQLSPIVSKEEEKYFNNKYGGYFFFHSPIYNEVNFIFCELKEVFRQSDKSFVNLLDRIREGSFTSEDIKILNKHYAETLPKNILQLVPTKKEVTRINQTELDKINSEEHLYKAVIVEGDNIKENDFTCSFELKLKVGALIMMIVNDTSFHNWVNGSLGFIKELADDEIIVSIKNQDYHVQRYEFSKYKCVLNQGKISYEIESSIKQFPLILAYAITIHKSQGMTYDSVICDLKDCFTPGQAYVALSRATNLDRLYLKNKVRSKDIITNKIVKEFYDKLRKVDDEKCQ